MFLKETFAKVLGLSYEKFDFIKFIKEKNLFFQIGSTEKC